jgi:hypothetical protein
VPFLLIWIYHVCRKDVRKHFRKNLLSPKKHHIVMIILYIIIFFPLRRHTDTASAPLEIEWVNLEFIKTSTKASTAVLCIRIRKNPKFFAGSGSGTQGYGFRSGTVLEVYQNHQNMSYLIIMTLKTH